MAANWTTLVKPASQVAEFAKSGPRAPKTAAEVVAAAIDKQMELFKNPKAEGRRWFEQKGDNVGFTIRYANSPLKLIGDETHVVVPKGRFVEVLTEIKADVIAGAFKDQLGASEAKVRQRTAKMIGKPRAPRKPK
jgi:hypothetical protein